MDYLQAIKGLKLRIIDWEKTSMNKIELPRNISELRDVEALYLNKGLNVKFYYEDNSGDAPILKEIHRYSDYLEALNHIDGQGLTFVSVAEVNNAISEEGSRWSCKFCMRVNDKAINICQGCQSPKPITPGISRIFD